MFATIMKSDTPLGVRSIVVVPTSSSVRVFTRIGESRGRAGAWHEQTPLLAADEKVVGTPVSIPITSSDYKALSLTDASGNHPTPTVLLQKAARELQGVWMSSGKDANEMFKDITERAENPSSLAIFSRAMLSFSAPVAQPVAQPVAPQPVVQEIAPPTTTQVKEPMNQSYMSAVLEVPELKPYFRRKFDGIDEHDVLDYARRTQQNVLYTGPAGTGKSSSAENYAASRNLPYHVIECTQQIDQSITQGRFVPTGNGNEMVWKDSALATIIQGPGVVLINEMSRMSPKAASLFLRLLQERELIIEPLNRVIKVHPECIFIADQNLGLGYNGTSKQDAALVDRFNIKLDFDYDTKIESNFIKSPTLLSFATAIREATEMSDEFSVPMSSRVLKNFQEQATSLNFAFAVSSLLSNFPKADGEREALKMRLDAVLDDLLAELGVERGSYK